MHDDAGNLDDETEQDEAASEEQDDNAHTLSIRTQAGEEVVTIFSPEEEWAVYLKPGGGIQNAYLGALREPTIWVSTPDLHVERDEDGTYVIRLG